MRTHVKVCGLTRPEDIDACVELGVDSIGFNCWPRSPRYVPPSTLGRLVRHVEGRASVVLVVVDSSPDAVCALLDATALTGARPWIQVHGGQPAAPYTAAGLRVTQVLRVGGTSVLPQVTADRVLLDVDHADFGGTGQRLGAADVLALRPRLPREWMLAGGLDASNVATAIRALGPWGVDVASGVESSPGVKDRARLSAFAAAVRGAEGDHAG
jgi:phosphoribosylanthranilate isomerase